MCINYRKNLSYIASNSGPLAGVTGKGKNDIVMHSEDDGVLSNIDTHFLIFPYQLSLLCSNTQIFQYQVLKVLLHNMPSFYL